LYYSAYSDPGYYGYDSGYGYAPPAYAPPSYGYAAPPAVNDNYAPEVERPAVREYVPPPSSSNYPGPPQQGPPPATTSSYYLIAFPNGSVSVVVAYWTKGDMLHYVTRDKVEHQLPISQIDRDLTEQLNHERNVEFRIPR
jgi:hypothetical protein